MKRKTHKIVFDENNSLLIAQDIKRVTESTKNIFLTQNFYLYKTTKNEYLLKIYWRNTGVENVGKITIEQAKEFYVDFNDQRVPYIVAFDRDKANKLENIINIIMSFENGIRNIIKCLFQLNFAKKNYCYGEPLLDRLEDIERNVIVSQFTFEIRQLEEEIVNLKVKIELLESENRILIEKLKNKG